MEPVVPPAPLVPMESLDKEAHRVNLARTVQKASQDKGVSVVKMVLRVLLVLQGKKGRLGHQVSLEQMVCLGLQEKGVPPVSVVLLVAMDLQAKRALLVNEVVRAVLGLEAYRVNPAVMEALVFQE